MPRSLVSVCGCLALAFSIDLVRQVSAPGAEQASAVRGTVVDETGAPLADLAITAFPRPRDPFPSWGNVAGAEQLLRSDASGRFEVPAAASRPSSSRPCSRPGAA